MKKSLFEGEEIVKVWNDCTLTNKRVWKLTEERGDSDYYGFPISKFQGAKVGKRSYPWLMYIGVGFSVLAFLSLFSQESNIGSFLAILFVAAVFLVGWHITRSAVVEFCSSQINIILKIHANDEDYTAAINFISEVERMASDSKSMVTRAA